MRLAVRLTALLMTLVLLPCSVFAASYPSYFTPDLKGYTHSFLAATGEEGYLAFSSALMLMDASTSDTHLFELTQRAQNTESTVYLAQMPSQRDTQLCYIYELLGEKWLIVTDAESGGITLEPYTEQATPVRKVNREMFWNYVVYIIVTVAGPSVLTGGGQGFGEPSYDKEAEVWPVWVDVSVNLDITDAMTDFEFLLDGKTRFTAHVDRESGTVSGRFQAWASGTYLVQLHFRLDGELQTEELNATIDCPNAVGVAQPKINADVATLILEDGRTVIDYSGEIKLANGNTITNKMVSATPTKPCYQMDENSAYPNIDNVRLIIGQFDVDGQGYELKGRYDVQDAPNRGYYQRQGSGSTNTYCTWFVRDVSYAMGADYTNEGMASTVNAWYRDNSTPYNTDLPMDQQKGWLYIGDGSKHQDAIEWAQQGYYVVGMHEGHLFIVYPHDYAGDDKQPREMYITHAGAQCNHDAPRSVLNANSYAAFGNYDASIRRFDKPSMHYYVWAGK